MHIPSFGIFKKDLRGNPVWIDAVEELEAARLRLNQLESMIPGEHFACDQRAHQIVEGIVCLGSDIRAVPA
jgi:hypothetical protein